jgi:hypothetical protein
MRGWLVEEKRKEKEKKRLDEGKVGSNSHSTARRKGFKERKVFFSRRARGR